VLTRAGKGYPARMAASLLDAVGLPELVTTSDEAYEALALELATNPDKLAELRQRLAVNRTTMPLFDSALFTRHIEEGYRLAYRRWLGGETPAAIEVPDLPS
jgi:predicted O-linked N-acetylglucosamine transferase (SPINDLY family)